MGAEKAAATGHQDSFSCVHDFAVFSISMVDEGMGCQGLGHSVSLGTAKKYTHPSYITAAPHGRKAGPWGVCYCCAFSGNPSARRIVEWSHEKIKDHCITPLPDQGQDYFYIHIHVITNNAVAQTNDAMPLGQSFLADKSSLG